MFFTLLSFVQRRRRERERKEGKKRRRSPKVDVNQRLLLKN